MGGRGGRSGVRGRGGGGGIADADRFNRSGESLPPGLRRALEDRFQTGTELGRDIYDHYIPAGGAVQDSRSPNAHYSPWQNMVWMSFSADARNPRGIGTTWLHEHGHFVDYNIGRSSGRNISDDRQFQQALKKDVERYECEYARVHNTTQSPTYNAARQVAAELRRLGDRTNGIQDIYGGVHRDRSNYYWGHDNSYWSGDRQVAVEAAAHMFEAQFASDKASYMQKYLPSAWSRYNDLLEQDRRRWRR